MPDYYIRTPDHDESRGPFDVNKLLTLAEAGQINENSLYYDESKEEWVPIALNKELCADVFPQREQLSLKVQKKQEELAKEEAQRDPGGNNVEEMLNAADGHTKHRKSIKRKEESLNKAASLSAPGIGIMMIASAIFLLYPHFDALLTINSEGTYSQLINYPFILLGLIDFILGIILFLAVTEVYPILRARSMLTLGFGAYVAWALSDPLLIAVSAMAGIGIFIATISQRYSIMIVALILGVGGNGYLAYLAVLGRFTGFFDSVTFDLISK